ncbi:hypothetical protein AVEN_187835-1 [Araneus ventricosus]|uniref:Uncharacterized protein n=1 Tax=Araneus ventricosus TaxID=182803 RepID=A0A4Y2CS87_ARAVE|nr:hypothetical protein AVEN_187835-1 [Araneus ventricosus]
MFRRHSNRNGCHLFVVEAVGLVSVWISNEVSAKMMMMINMMKSLSNILSFFFRLAWESRIRLPVILTVWFMVLDVRMQLEINVNLGQNQIDA